MPWVQEDTSNWTLDWQPGCAAHPSGA